MKWPRLDRVGMEVQVGNIRANEDEQGLRILRVIVWLRVVAMVVIFVPPELELLRCLDPVLLCVAQVVVADVSKILVVAVDILVLDDCAANVDPGDDRVRHVEPASVMGQIEQRIHAIEDVANAASEELQLVGCEPSIVLRVVVGDKLEHRARLADLAVVREVQLFEVHGTARWSARIVLSNSRVLKRVTDRLAAGSILAQARGAEGQYRVQRINDYPLELELGKDFHSEALPNLVVDGHRFILGSAETGIYRRGRCWLVGAAQWLDVDVHVKSMEVNGVPLDVDVQGVESVLDSVVIALEEMDDHGRVLLVRCGKLSGPHEGIGELCKGACVGALPLGRWHL